MESATIGGKEVTYYTSVDELPMKRFFLYNKHLIIDGGIGADMEAIDGHLLKAMRYIKNGDKENANKQLQNLRTSLYYVTEEFNPRFTSFACLVKSIGGRECNDLSDEGLGLVVSELSALQASRGLINDFVDRVKKKLRLNFKRSSRAGSTPPPQRSTTPK